jgi:hypothetical protein
MKTLLRQEIRAPGESIVFGKFSSLLCRALVAKTRSAACGDPDFTHAARDAVLEYSKPGRLIYFLESEYRPHSLVSTAGIVSEEGSL